MVGTVSTVAKLMYIPVITLATMTSGNVHIHCTILFPPPPSTFHPPLSSSLTLPSVLPHNSCCLFSFSCSLPPTLPPPSPLLLPQPSPPPSPLLPLTVPPHFSSSLSLSLPPHLSSSLSLPLPPHLSSRYNHSVSNL